ncbi:MAG: class I SAM-dependent methyltransferase [Myxococcota bacterium]|nr:class I SAM-dependent methyltransferase [Myxococcota bacterium]
MKAKRWAVQPKPDPHWQETFEHHTYVRGTEEERLELRRLAAELRYETAFEFVDAFFEGDLQPYVGKDRLLDLGCFSGGKTVAYQERFGVREAWGIDVREVYIEAAREFASRKQANAFFRVGVAEDLPFPDGNFDTIISTDVFEHVTDVSRALNECYRVLRPGGRLIVVFPSYWHPLEHHLSLVTRMPFIHFLAQGSALVEIYNEIIDERGESAAWYRREHPSLLPHERCNTINGTTRRDFKKLVEAMAWEIEADDRGPTIARLNPNDPPLKRAIRPVAWRCLNTLSHLPLCDEVFALRIAMILRKPRVPDPRLGSAPIP